MLKGVLKMLLGFKLFPFGASVSNLTMSSGLIFSIAIPPEKSDH